MNNREFQDILAQYPDEYEIQIDNAFGWEVPSNKYKEDPHLYINTDCGFIEIEGQTCRDIWVKTKEERPEDGTTCIINLSSDPKRTMYKIVTYHKDHDEFTSWNYYDDCQNHYKAENIQIWMPIPSFCE